MPARRERALKVVVTSATLDGEKFSAYFNACPVFHVSEEKAGENKNVLRPRGGGSVLRAVLEEGGPRAGGGSLPS